MGSHTVPDDVAIRVDESDASYGPPTNQDANQSADKRGGSNWLLVMLLMIILAVSAWLGQYVV